RLAVGHEAQGVRPGGLSDLPGALGDEPEGHQAEEAVGRLRRPTSPTPAHAFEAQGVLVVRAAGRGRAHPDDHWAAEADADRDRRRAVGRRRIGRAEGHDVPLAAPRRWREGADRSEQRLAARGPRARTLELVGAERPGLATRQVQIVVVEADADAERAL